MRPRACVFWSSASDMTYECSTQHSIPDLATTAHITVYADCMLKDSRGDQMNRLEMLIAAEKHQFKPKM